MDWPTRDWQRAVTVGSVTGSSAGTQVTASGSTNTKGSWAAIATATDVEAVAVLVQVRSVVAGAAIDGLLDIGIGGSGSEAPLIANLKVDSANPGVVGRSAPILWPIPVPAGSRLSARYQATTGSSTVRVSLTLFTGTFGNIQPYGRVTTYGAAVGDSGGVSINPGGTINTKGSWTAITTATTAETRALVIGIGSQTNDTRAAFRWHLDIGIGANPNETAIISNLVVEAFTSTDDLAPILIGPIPVSIPVGERLSARSQCSGSDATDRTFDVVLYGID